MLLLQSTAVFLLLLAISADGRAQSARLVLTPGPVTSTVAGGGTTFSGAGTHLATGSLRDTAGVSVSSSGDLIVADTANTQVKRVAPDGTVVLLAGTGKQGFSGDGGRAVNAELDHPLAAVSDAHGSVWIADTRNHRIRRLAPDGTITTVAGNGAPAFQGDGAPAPLASLRFPSSLTVSDSGVLYIADTGNHRVRYVDTAGIMGTVAGNGMQGFLGDGGPAVSASLDSPAGVALDRSGNLLIADRRNNSVRVVDARGIIRTLTGRSTSLAPVGVAVADTGNVYVASSRNHQITESVAGTFLPVAGSGVEGPFHSGADPLDTALARPSSIAVEHNGGLVVADRGHSQIQRIALPQIDFPAIPAGGVSQPRTLTLQNGGGANLYLQKALIPPGFSAAASSSCGAFPRTLRPGETCSVDLTFTPSAQGAQIALLTVSAEDVAPQNVRLSGFATAPGSLAPSRTALASSGTIAYAGVPVTFLARVSGSTTVPPVGNVQLLENTTAVAQTVLDAAGTASFSLGTLSLGPHTLHAAYMGDLHYSASDSSTTDLRVAQAPDFSLALTGPILQTMATGGSKQVTFLLQPLGGPLAQPVTLSLTGIPAGWSSSFSPATPMLASVPITLTLDISTTTAGHISANRARLGPKLGSQLLLSAGLLVFCLRRKYRPAFALLSLLCVSGCGSGYLGGGTAANSTKSQSYPLTVTARATGVTGAALIHSATVTLSTN